MKKLFLLFYFILFISSYSEQKKNILILHSYSEDYLWTKQIHKGLFEATENIKKDYIFYVEYMDTKKFNSKEYLNAYDKAFSYKYSHKKIDLVIAVDDNAFSYAMSKRKDILENIPILGTGLNTVKEKYFKFDNVYQIFEEPNYESNIKLALKQNPNAKKIYFIIDSTVTGQNIKRKLSHVLKKYKVKTEWLDNLTLKELEEKIAKLDDSNIIEYFLFSKDKSDKNYTYNEPISRLSRISKIPIYINWDFYLNTGAFGGDLYSGEKLGIQTFINARKILDGDYVSKFINAKQKSNYIFDYNIIKNKNFKIASYPLNVSYINKPESFYEKNKKIILTFSTIILIIIIILILVYLNLVKQKIINLKNKELLETQKEILYRLGNVIESRSKETANHVERVAKISKFIALNLGFKLETAEIIEIASPLHDVGKIGIPDNILNFPGKYNSEQFKVMKQHSTIGYNILKNSEKKIIEAAAIIAHEHHERWDGTGYPRNLKGDEIHIFARITAVADVIDALLNKRVYKKAWQLEETFNYISQEKGNMFDPQIVEIIEKHKEELCELIKRYD